MKTRKYFILIAVAFVLVMGLLGQANISNEQDREGIFTEKAFPTGKITDRHAFVEGALFAKQEIREMRYKEALDAPSDQKDILAGLDGVQVVVEGVNTEAEKYGLIQQVLQTDTELLLRQYGIKIPTDEETMKNYAHRLVEQREKDIEYLKTKALSLMESFDEKNSDEHFLQCLRDVILHGHQQTSSSLLPNLYVNVNTNVSEESGRAVFSIQVKLNEGADLCRNGAFCQAPIWEKGGVARCSSRDLKEYVRECLRDYLDEFINDYLAANPKDRFSDNES